MPNVQIITARAHRLLAPVIAEIGALYSQGKSCVLLVPEQFTLQAERELLTRLRLEGFFLIQVLSPSRLGEHVLAAAGVDARKPLDASGRQMAISCALERCESDLLYYRSAVHRRGFVEKLAALLTDMKRGGLSPEGLRAYADTLEEGREKCADIAAVYAAYEALLQARFSDGEDQLHYVASRLAQSGFLQGKHVFVYGFDALPQQLMELLSAMAPLCEGLTVALVADGESAPDGDLYLPIRQGIGRFTALMEKQSLPLRQKTLPREPLAAAPAIQHLDQALFSHPPTLFQQPQEQVFLSVHQSPFEEASVMARQILRLCSQGTDIERIAVIYPDENGYALAVSTALSDAGLPFYTDQKLPATSHGLVRFLLCALRATANGYRNEEMTGMLKSGYAPLSFAEACALENYAVAYGIDRFRWTSPLRRGTEAEQSACEPLRLRLMEPLLRLRESLVAAKDAHASLKAVFGLLQDMNAYETLKQEEEALLAEGLAVRANQNSQVWQALLTLLEQLLALSGGGRVPLKHIANRLECGFAAISLAALPPASGMLHVGTLGHYLSGDMDAVFLLGLNDGILARSANSLLSEEEREKAQQDTGTFLGLTDKSRTLLAKLDLKQAMTLASRFLFISHAKTAPDGKALRPLALLDTLQKQIFSGLPQGPVPLSALPLSATQALGELSVRLRAYADGTGEVDHLPGDWQALLARLLHSPATAERAMRLLRAADYNLEATPLSQADARTLFGGETLSVSRLEQFAQCPFKHFVTYGLRPHTVRPWRVEPLDTGNFYHAGLHQFSTLTASCPGYPHIAPEQVDALAEEAIEPLIGELMRGPMGDGARSQALFQRARRILHRAALTVTRHLAAGQFQLAKTEATFGYPGGMPPIILALTDGREVFLRGKIDRVDRFENDESVYLRVIDYKSSRQDLDAAKTWWGLQLQLLLYLDACVCAEPAALPAGAFYFYVADPLVESDTDAQAIVEKELSKLLQLKGIALADVEVLHAMDGGTSPVALPKMLDKAGSLLNRAKALELAELQALLSHAREAAVAMAEGIFSGQTTIRPTLTGDRLACDFCDWADICGFDPNLPGGCLQSIPAMDIASLRSLLVTRTEENYTISEYIYSIKTN